MVGVIYPAGLNQEVVAFRVAGQIFYGCFGHLQDGRLVAFVASGQAVMVIAQVTRGKQAENFAISRWRDDWGRTTWRDVRGLAEIVTNAVGVWLVVW